VPGLLYSFIPLPARVASKELAKVYKRLLLIARGAKLVRRLVYRVLPFPTLTLTTLTTLLALLQAYKALPLLPRVLLALTRARKSLIARTPTRSSLSRTLLALTLPYSSLLALLSLRSPLLPLYTLP
jgi:hypothetical protein